MHYLKSVEIVSALTIPLAMNKSSVLMMHGVRDYPKTEQINERYVIC